MNKDLIKEVISCILIVVFVLLFRSYFYSPIKVNGTSMDPNLKDGEIMILDKVRLRKGINRFDIVVVKSDDTYIIKRVIGLPGETIIYEDNKLYIDGKIVEDKYGYGDTSFIEKITLDDDSYYVLGDNREVSKDSRIIGPVDSASIVGKANLVIFPFSKVGMVE